MDSNNQILFSPAPLSRPQPVRVPNLMNSLRFRGMNLDGDPFSPNIDPYFAVPASDFPQRAPLLSRRPSRVPGNHQFSDQNNLQETEAFVNGEAAYLLDTLVPASPFPDHQRWTEVHPSYLAAPSFDPIAPPQGSSPTVDTTSTDPPDLLAAEAFLWNLVAGHPLMPFCPFAPLLFLKSTAGGDPIAHGMALNGLEMMDHPFPGQCSENRGHAPTGHSVQQVNLGSAPSTSSNPQESLVEIVKPTLRMTHANISNKSPRKGLPYPRKSTGVKASSPVDNTLLGTIFTDASSNPNRALRELLDAILASDFLNDQQQEPLLTEATGRSMVGKLSDIAGYPQICLRRGAQSLYTLFLEQKSNKCLFCGSYKGVLSRAVGCVRKHLGHKPFVCDGMSCELCNERSDGPSRFYTSSLLKDHIKSRTQKIDCVHEDCPSMLRRGNIHRHWQAMHPGTPFPYDVYKRYTRSEPTMSPISMSSNISFSSCGLT